MKRIISIVLVCFLLCGCTATNNDVNSSFVSTESIFTNTSDISSIVSSDDSLNSDVLLNDDTITSSTVLQDTSSAIETPFNSDNDQSVTSEPNLSETSSSNDTPQQSQVSDFSMGEGNSYANIVNSQGVIAYSGDWIFISSKDDNGALYKIKNDGTGIQRIGSDVDCEYINVVGDWIVYKCSEDRGIAKSYNIVKIKTDGSGREVLTGGWAITYAYVCDKKLYYGRGTNVSDASVYVMDLDTKKSTKYDEPFLPVTNHYAIPPYFDDEWVYYLDSYKINYRYGNLFRKKINGTEEVKLTDNVVRKFDIFDGWIYYIDYDFHIRRVRIDGTDDSSVFTDDYISCLEVTKDGVFATGRKIYKISYDGTDYVQYAPSAFSDFFFSVASDYIYFIPILDDGKYNKLKRISIDAHSNDMGELLPFVVDW